MSLKKTERIQSGRGNEQTQSVELRWIERINSGDPKAFESMVRAYGAKLCRFASHIVKSDAIAEELVQEVFCNIWEKRTEWRPNPGIGGMKSYLYVAVRNQAIGYLRHRKFENLWWEETDVIDEQAVAIDDELHAVDFSHAVQQAIADLPDRCRLIFKLHREDGLTYAEIAQILELSPKTVKAQIARALKILRSRLAPYLSILLLMRSI